MPTIDELKKEIRIQEGLQKDIHLIATIQRYQSSFGLFTHLSNEEAMDAATPGDDLRKRILVILDEARLEYQIELERRRGL